MRSLKTVPRGAVFFFDYRLQKVNSNSMHYRAFNIYQGDILPFLAGPFMLEWDWK
jgi:hypothetical protein